MSFSSRFPKKTTYLRYLLKSLRILLLYFSSPAGSIEPAIIILKTGIFFLSILPLSFDICLPALALLCIAIGFAGGVVEAGTLSFELIKGILSLKYYIPFSPA